MMMMLQAILGVCLLVYAQAAEKPITFSADPKLAVVGINEDIILDCQIPPAITDVYMGLMVMVKQASSDGDGELLNVLMTSSELEKTGENRTEVSGNLKTPDGDDPSTFLNVRILEPVEDDSGVYECQILYLNTKKEIQNFATSVSVNVSAIPPPVYVFQETEEENSTCECESIWNEINNIKEALNSRGPAPVVSSGSDACQVSFSAQFQSRNGYVITDGVTAMFDLATTNKGDAYDVTSGEFTAPCDGQYFFTVVMRSHQDLDAGYVDGVLMVDDVATARTSVFTDSAAPNMQQAATGRVVALTAGQKVKVVVKTSSSGQFIGNEYSVFSGFYVSP